MSYQFLHILVAFTSIKVRETDKKEFDRLLHEAALRTGSDISQHELFHRILEHALSSKDDLLAAAARATKGSWARFQIDLPEPTDAANDIDRVVYGLDR